MKQKIDPLLKWGCITPILAVIALIVVALSWDRFVPSAPRRALPRSATEVQEYYKDHWNGDFVRLIKAKLPEADVPRYAEALGLKRRFDPVADRALGNGLHGFAGQTWFTPPPSDATTYVDHRSGDDFFRILSYSGGFVYFVAYSS